MSNDVHTLTGAYVADALPADERRFFERHLTDCAACDVEVRELLEVAATLAASSETEPPRGMKAAVLQRVATSPQQQRATEPAGRARRSPARTHARTVGVVPRVLIPVAAVPALVAVVASVTAATLSTRVDELEMAAQQMNDLMHADDARFVQMEGPGGSRVRVVMSLEVGTAVFLVTGMEPAPLEHTYELWLIRDDHALPAGVFDVDDGGMATRLVSGDMEGATAIGVTIEPLGGSPTPTSDPIMVVPLTS